MLEPQAVAVGCGQLPRHPKIRPLIQLDRVHVRVQERDRRTDQARSGRSWRDRKISNDVVLEKAHNHQIRLKCRADGQQLRQFLARVVPRHRSIPHLPVDIGTPRPQPLLEQIRIGVLVDRPMPERHRIAKHQDPERPRSLRKNVLAIIAEFQPVDLHRHTGKPSRVARREPLNTNRIRQKEPRHALPRIPGEAHPPFDRQRDDDERQEGRGDTDRDQPWDRPGIHGTSVT